MSMDRTLRARGGLAKTRSVQTRAERIARLIDEDKFDPKTARPFGLPKAKIRHSKAGTKSKKAEEAPVEAVAGAPVGAEQAEKPKGTKTPEAASTKPKAK